jgi:flagellar basal body rod protein FlgC
MSSVGSIATSGMTAASLQLQMSARKIANLSSPGAGVDLASEIVQQLMARVSFAANAQVLKADARMTASLLDIVA